MRSRSGKLRHENYYECYKIREYLQVDIEKADNSGCHELVIEGRCLLHTVYICWSLNHGAVGDKTGPQCSSTPHSHLLPCDLCTPHSAWPWRYDGSETHLELGLDFVSSREDSVCMLSGVWLFATSWTVALQAPLSVGFPGKNTAVGCTPSSRRKTGT